MQEISPNHRQIKSYVLRAGRVSNRQQQALDLWASHYELDSRDGKWALEQVFNREAETIVEIGFGMGRSLSTQAQAHPEINFIGIEVHRAGVGSLVADLHEHDIQNVRIASFDAVQALSNNIEDQSLSGVQIFFPDPWPKKRHHKRRLIQAEFVNLISQKLKVGGFIHCATDWEEYAYHMMDVLAAEPSLISTQPQNQFAPRPESRPLTKFEQRGKNLGHGVWDLIFKKR